MHSLHFIAFFLTAVGAFQPRMPKMFSSPNMNVMAPELTYSQLHSSFAADGSEYSSTSKDFDMDDDYAAAQSMTKDRPANMDEEDETPTIELQPLPLSKNSGSRFLAILWDAELTEDKSLDANDLHERHVEHTENHVMYCRKANLYNETFNTDSMVDVLWSYPILSSDLERVIGHAMCLETTKIHYIHEFLQSEPTCQAITNGQTEKIPIFRWRHIRDYSLRIDDGRNGYPCMCIAMDADDEDSADIRIESRESNLKYLIESSRVIATGPMHVATERKEDPESVPVGDFILFNAEGRDHAIDFVENLPSAQMGLYDDLRVHFYNNLDVTGKYVSEDPLRDSPCQDMQEALGVWGYPIGEDQTPHLIN